MPFLLADMDALSTAASANSHVEIRRQASLDRDGVQVRRRIVEEAFLDR